MEKKLHIVDTLDAQGECCIPSIELCKVCQSGKPLETKFELVDGDLIITYIINRIDAVFEINTNGELEVTY